MLPSPRAAGGKWRSDSCFLQKPQKLRNQLQGGLWERENQLKNLQPPDPCRSAPSARRLSLQQTSGMDAWSPEEVRESLWMRNPRQVGLKKDAMNVSILEAELLSPPASPHWAPGMLPVSSVLEREHKKLL